MRCVACTVWYVLLVHTMYVLLVHTMYVLLVHAVRHIRICIYLCTREHPGGCNTTTTVRVRLMHPTINTVTPTTSSVCLFDA